MNVLSTFYYVTMANAETLPAASSALAPLDIDTMYLQTHAMVYFSPMFDSRFFLSVFNFKM